MAETPSLRPDAPAVAVCLRCSRPFNAHPRAKDARCFGFVDDPAAPCLACGKRYDEHAGAARACPSGPWDFQAPAAYYCENRRCAWRSYAKPCERRCPACGSTVWKDGTAGHKQRPALPQGDDDFAVCADGSTVWIGGSDPNPPPPASETLVGEERSAPRQRESASSSYSASPEGLREEIERLTKERDLAKRAEAGQQRANAAIARSRDDQIAYCGELETRLASAESALSERTRERDEARAKEDALRDELGDEHERLTKVRERLAEVMGALAGLSERVSRLPAPLEVAYHEVGDVSIEPNVLWFTTPDPEEIERIEALVEIVNAAARALSLPATPATTPEVKP